ncbi:immunoglobulin-like domain-containing protein [Cytobacillus sp. FJAT-53684]|uniref:Immunoglobulin-like domain-containing protein n=1 Tax=Cytobacillus mangrovibacter TaxID=3299024 RepID=A0ABW6K3G9_9BACI
MTTRKRNKNLYKGWLLFLCALILIGQIDFIVPSIVKAEGQRTSNTQETSVSIASANFSGGDGSEEHPYEITTKEELNEVRNHLDKYFILKNDIELTENWEPIGEFQLPNVTEEQLNDENFDPSKLVIDDSKGFEGSFDGNGNTISGLKMTSKDPNGINGVFGLFGFTNGATIKDLTIVDISIDADSTIAVGGLVGKAMDTTIEKISITGTVAGMNKVGGLVGTADSLIIENSNSSATVKGTDEIGGLIGSSEKETTVKTSYTKSETSKVIGKSKVGGLIGNANDTAVSSSYSTLNVEGADMIGGLIGVAESGASIKQVYATGNVEGINNTGGLIGLARGEEIEVESGTPPPPIATTIKEAYAKGTVKGVFNVGGLIGLVEPHTQVENTYAMGSVTGVEGEPEIDDGSQQVSPASDDEELAPIGGAVGGLIGFMDQSSIEHSYSIGEVNGIVKEYVAGLIGITNLGEVTESYFDNQTSKQTFAIGTVERVTNTTTKEEDGKDPIVKVEESFTTIDEVAGRSTEAMKNPLTFENWMFKTIWVSNKDANKGYLFLRFQDEFKDKEHIEKIETPEEKVVRAKENLTVPGDLTNVTSDLILPKSQNGVTVTWTSNNTNWVKSDGKVTRPEPGQSNVSVTLTATLSFSENGESATDTAKFTVTVVAKPKRAEDVDVRINNRALIGSIKNNNPDNAFMNFKTGTPGFYNEGTWESSLNDGTLIRGSDNGAGATLTIKVWENPQLKALAEGGTADVLIGWKGLKFNKFGCFLAWCKTRVTDASIIVYDGDSNRELGKVKGSARGRNDGSISAKVRLTKNSRIVVSFGIEGKGAGVDGMYVKFQDKTRPKLENYTFVGNGEERTNNKIKEGSKQELFVKESEYVSLSYNFSKAVSPSSITNQTNGAYFLSHPLFVNTPGTGLPASGRQQYFINETYKNDSNLSGYHESIEYKYIGTKYHNSGNNPITPDLTGNKDSAPLDQTMEQKLNAAVLIDGAGNVADINNMNVASNASKDHLKGKTVDPFNYNDPNGYRVIIDAVAPKYTKVGNGIQPEILTGVVLNENDTIDFTVQLSEEAIVRKGWDVSKTHLLFNNGMKAYYVSGAGTDKWKFRAEVTNAKTFETPLLKVVALTHDNNNQNPSEINQQTQKQLETNVLQDYAGNYLIQPANFDGEHNEGTNCTRVFHEYDDKGEIVKNSDGTFKEISNPSDKKCDPSLVNSKIDWANLSIDNTKSIISHRYDTGGATDAVYKKNGRITIDANDPQLMVPPLDPAPVKAGDIDIRNTFRPSKGIYRPSNMTGPQAPAAGLVYYYWSQNPEDPLTGKENDYFAAIKRFSLSAKQPGEDLYKGNSDPANNIKLAVVNNKTNMIAPPADALKSDKSGQWYLHMWTADMSWDSARELMQYEKMKAYVKKNPDQYNEWKEEYAEDNPKSSEADQIFYADNEALKAVGDYADLETWPLEDFKQKDSNWVYEKATLLLDNQKPVLTFDEPIGDKTANVTIKAQVKDIHSGFKNVQYQWVKKGLFGSGEPKDIDWTDVKNVDKNVVKDTADIVLQTGNDIMIDGDGKYELYIKVTDEAGNEKVQQMDGEITVDSTFSMEVSFLPEPSANYVKSHDIVFQVLSGLTPDKVEYAFSSSIEKPSIDLYNVAETITNDKADTLVAKIVEDIEADETKEELENELNEDENMENPDENSDLNEQDSKEEDSQLEDELNGESSEEAADQSNEKVEQAEIENDDQNEGFFTSLYHTVKDFVVGLFTSNETADSSNQEVFSYLIPKDETKNGPVYLHVKVTENGVDYHFTQTYLFNNQGPGIYFSSYGVAFPKESHEVSVTIERPYKNEQLSPNEINVEEGVQPEEGLQENESQPEIDVAEDPSVNDESENAVEGKNENSTVTIQSLQTNGEDTFDTTLDSTGEVQKEETSGGNLDTETNVDSTEEDPNTETNEAGKEEEQEPEKILVEKELVEGFERYQWVKGVKGNFVVDENKWIDLPEDGKVSIDYKVLEKDEQLAEFELFVWTMDEIGNETKADTNKEGTPTFKVMRPMEEDLSQPLKSEFDLLYLYGDEEDGYTAIVEMKFEEGQEQLIRGYEYSLSPDGGKSWSKWRPYTNFASIKVPTNDISKLDVQVKYRTGAGVISEKGTEVKLNTATVSQVEPVYALASLSTTRPVNGATGVDLMITPPLGIRVVPTPDVNPVVPERTTGNTFKVVENGYYSFDLSDIDNPERKATLYVVINNIDSTSPIGDIEYLTPPDLMTNANKTVKLITDEPVQVTNNNGEFTHTFTTNGSFTFEFKDEAGNISSATAEVRNIDKEGPRVKIVRIYDDHKTITDKEGNVFTSGVTLEVQKADANAKDFIVNGTPENNNGRVKVITENGYATFTVSDAFGNTTIAKEKVDNIISAGPEVTNVKYTFVDESGDIVPENQMVEINGVKYAKGQMKVTLSGQTDPMNQVFLGTAPIKDDKGNYMNQVSDSEGQFNYSRIFSVEGNTSIPFTDLLGNVERVPVQIKGLDNTAPEIKLNMATAGVERNKKDFDSQVDLGGFIVTDNVSSSDNIKVKVTGLDLSQLGLQRVTYTATDEVGNTTIAYQDVYVVNDAGMLIFANDVLISAEAGVTALFNENKLTFNITRYNIMNVEGKDRVNEVGTFDVMYQSGLYREGQMKYIAEKITYDELVNGNFEVTFPKAGWYTLIVRNQEREREYGSFFIGNSK